MLPTTTDVSSPSGTVKSLYVGNLSHYVTEDALREIFSTLGKVAECKVIKDKNTGLPAGYGFVRFEDHRQDLFPHNCFGGLSALTAPPRKFEHDLGLHMFKALNQTRTTPALVMHLPTKLINKAKSPRCTGLQSLHLHL